ncbi:MAG: hypothetical protein ACRYG4_14320, partial [Janthinobacterium lividum]
VADAETERRAADVARETANIAMLGARGTAAALASERDGLARLLAAGGPSADLLDRITVAAGDERALAAALGEDVAARLGEQASGRFWIASNGDDDPGLPPGVEALAAHCTAPAELHRRLRQTGIVEAEAAPALATMLVPGQRLVTRDGRLWRWDGFRAFGGQGVATAERLIQRNRMVALKGEIDVAEADLARAHHALATANDRSRIAAAAERDARTARGAAERALDAARAGHAAAAAGQALETTKREALEAAIVHLTDDAASLAREVEMARTAAGEVTGLPALAEAVTTTRATVERARSDLARARAAQAALVRDVGAGAARLTAIAAERASWVRRHAASNAHIAELDDRGSAAASEQAGLAGRPTAIADEQGVVAGLIAAREAARGAAAAALAAAETVLRATDAEVRRVAESLGIAREVRARAATNFEHEDARRIEIEALSGERFGCPPPLLPVGTSGRSIAEIGREFDTLSVERDRMGPVNLRADLELAELDAAAAGSTAERAELETAIARLRGSIGSLNREGRVRLLAAFTAVDGHFKQLFATLFAGGAAHLELIEADDPLEAGLEIMAQPPGKKLQSLTLLSGGEQALTAVALIFALFLTNPAPICVLDEVDAPLDDANVERFCDLLDRMAATTATRFLIVTHNAVTMSRMHRLYGVTMAEQGVSQLVSVDLRRAGHLLAAE